MELTSGRSARSRGNPAMGCQGLDCILASCCKSRQKVRLYLNTGWERQPERSGRGTGAADSEHSWRGAQHHLRSTRCDRDLWNPPEVPVLLRAATTSTWPTRAIGVGHETPKWASSSGRSAGSAGLLLLLLHGQPRCCALVPALPGRGRGVGLGNPGSAVAVPEVHAGAVASLLFPPGEGSSAPLLSGC